MMSNATDNPGEEHPSTPSGHSVFGVGRPSGLRFIATAVGQVRTNFSVQHLMAAAKLARDAKRVEEANRGQAFGSFFEEVLGASAGCVLLSAAAAEAYVNEVFIDRASNFSGRDQLTLDLFWEEFEQKSPMAKYDLALRLSVQQRLDAGNRTSQSLGRLTDLRNALTHFKPEWPDEAVKHPKLSRQIAGYVVRSQWFPDEDLFPRAWASHGTCRWAVSTVIDFVADFSTRSGIQNRLGKQIARLDPE